MSVSNDHKLAYDYHLGEAARGLRTAQVLLSTELRRKAPDVSDHGTVADYRNLQVASLAVSDLLGAEVSDFERNAIQAFPNTVDVWPFVWRGYRLRVAHVLEDVVRHLEAAWRLRSWHEGPVHGGGVKLHQLARLNTFNVLAAVQRVDVEHLGLA